MTKEQFLAKYVRDNPCQFIARKANFSTEQVLEIMEAYKGDVEKQTEKELTDALTYLLACNTTPRFKCELNLAIKKAEDILSDSKSKTK